MHHARSRQGCLTCRSKKVKCDEQTPRCRRCHRLELKCDWAKPSGRLRPTSKSKSRTRPDYPKILPRSISRAAELRHDQHEIPIPNPWHLPIVISPPDSGHATRLNELLLNDAVTDLSVTAFHDSPFAPAWGDLAHGLEFFGSAIHANNSAGFEDTDESPSTVLDCPSLGRIDPHSTMQVQWPLQPETVLSVPSLGVSWQNMVLSQEFLQTGKEADALQYYTSLYPTMTISKNVRWSSYMIVLRYSSQEPMAMHLLIAASLMDLATSQDGNVEMSSAAHTHAKAGMVLLKAAMAPEANHDPVSVIIATFFLYRYMAVAQGLHPEAITEWSEAASNYVKEKRLDDLCAGTNAPATVTLNRREAPLTITHQKKTHMARLMLWTFYEDIFASVKGYGGALARHFCEKPEQSREIYQYSCAELESVWGSDYPEREILDDVENAPIISFLYEVLSLYAEVNRAVSSPLCLAAAKTAVEEKIEKLEARSRALIRLTTINVQPRSRVMLNADYMVPFFYALRVYCFRSFLSEENLALPSPPVVQSSVASILQLAQRSLSRGPLDPMRARFQLPLFMAGIETTDRIHKEWVQSKMKTANMAMAFQTIVCLEEETQRRTPMTLIRQLMNNKNSVVPL